MPSTTSSSVSRLFASSTVITPSLPTFRIASASIRPISLSPLAEIVPTWAISSEVVTFLERPFRSSTTAWTAMSTPRLRSIGFRPAATALAPSRTIEAARMVAVAVPSPDRPLALPPTPRPTCGPLADDRGGEDGGGGGAVAGEVAGLARHLAHHLRAHVLELVGELDLLGDGHAVLGDPRRAEALLEHDVAALGPQRHLHRVGEGLDAAQHLGARVGGEADVLGGHLGRLLTSCSARLPARSGGGLRRLRGTLLEDAHDVRLLHDQQLVAVDLDLGAGPLAEQDAVADLHVELDQLALLVAHARADGEDLALHRLLLGGVGDDDPAPGLLLLLDAPDGDAVVQRPELHGLGLLSRLCGWWIASTRGSRVPTWASD